jgi:hypothetical protein
LRYEDLLDAEPLDRDGAISTVGTIEQWANTELEGSG